MKLTLEELELAIEVAKDYPEGHGHDWGTGPMTDEAFQGFAALSPETVCEYG